ncbi:MAG: LytR/AlgR family response regulator transcription factor [Janthinobacterium lividum]
MAADFPLQVLVVEDEPLFAEQLEAALNDLTYHVIGPAPDAATAMRLFRSASPPPDVVLLDISLGRRGPDGVELARQLLAERPVPLIFLTSQTDAESFGRARAVGPAAYLVKPVDAASLQRAIELAVANFVAAPADEDEAPEGGMFATASTSVLLPHALFVKQDGLLVKVALADISWVMSEGKHCRLALSAGRTVLVRQPLREISQHLPAGQFVQIQRSYLINAECIERLDPVRNIVQVSGQLLPLSRAYRDELLERLHLV